MKIKLDDGAYMPERAHDTDAGLDIRSPIAATVFPKDSVIIDTGVHIELPNNTVGMLKSKSGLNVKHDFCIKGDRNKNYVKSHSFVELWQRQSCLLRSYRRAGMAA